MDRHFVTVFGSSIPADGDEEYHLAYRLGKLLALNGFDVCSGGYRGIMEAVSKGVVENGGTAVGITLSYSPSPANHYLSEEIKCGTLFERIEKLIAKGEAYIVLQGGTGTLLELAAVWEFMNKGLLPPRPIACHSILWKEIGSLMENQIVRENRSAGLVKYFGNIEDIVTYLHRRINLKETI